MSSEKHKIFLSIERSKIMIGAFQSSNLQTVFFKKYNCELVLEEKNFDLSNAEKIIEKIIVETEKATGQFINDIYLIIDSPSSSITELSLSKNNEGKKIEVRDILYLIQDCKQQILRSNFDKEIVHIILNNYFVDGNITKVLPKDIECKKFSIDLQFICFSKEIIRKFEKLFNDHQININRIICTKYVKSLVNLNDYNICELGLKVVEGLNKQEVVLIPKKQEKKGFFERLFHFFR